VVRPNLLNGEFFLGASFGAKLGGGAFGRPQGLGGWLWARDPRRMGRGFYVFSDVWTFLAYDGPSSRPDLGQNVATPSRIATDWVPRNSVAENVGATKGKNGEVGPSGWARAAKGDLKLNMVGGSTRTLLHVVVGQTTPRGGVFIRSQIRPKGKGRRSEGVFAHPRRVVVSWVMGSLWRGLEGEPVGRLFAVAPARSLDG